MNPGVAADRPTVVAAFDLDKTLTTRDCVLPFLWSLGGWGFRGRLLVRVPRLVLAGIRRDRDRAKAVLTWSALRDQEIARVNEHAERFADRVVADWLRPDTVARLNWHRESGHQVVIVSASYEVYVRRIAERIGARAALATRLGVDTRGRFSGELDGPNCRGSEKSARLRSWFADEGLDPDVLYAYGDSSGDRQMLEMSTHPHFIGKNPLAARPEDPS